MALWLLEPESFGFWMQVLLCTLLLQMRCPCLVETLRQLHVTVRTKKLARPSVLGIWMPPDVTLIGNILSLCRCHTFANPKAGRRHFGRSLGGFCWSAAARETALSQVAADFLERYTSSCLCRIRNANALSFQIPGPLRGRCHRARGWKMAFGQK